MEKTRRLGRLGKNDESSLAITLADELATASRAAGRASAVAWGTRILWGGVLFDVLTRFLDASANAAGTVALISLILAFIAGVAVCLTKSGAVPNETRRRAMLAARRLERRFPEQTGVWVAGVDFCCDPKAENGRTSAALRDATTTLAARRLATVAAETDVGSWRAILTGESGELFDNLRKKAVVCVLGVLANLALLINGAIWDGGGGEKRGTFSLSGVAASVNDDRDDKNKGNEGSGEKEENKEVEKSASIEENKETRDGEISAAAVGESLGSGDFLTGLEVLISDLTQNAEIAEVLETELENAAVDERTGAEKSGISDAATRFLLLARELNANLTRPKTGILAQVRRLKELSRREQATILERLGKIGEKERLKEIEGIEKKVEIKKIGGIRNIGGEENNVAGKEIALFLLASRLNVLEAKMLVAETQELAAALGLSVVLRSDSDAERAKALGEAARRAGEWATMLRRETTAAQILKESWAFDETSQSWRAASETAWQKNQTLLARFAGRSTRDAATVDFADVAFENAKERFVDAWKNARSLEKERFEIVERLLERLQAEEAEEFIESVGAENGLPGGDLLGNDEWDAAAWEAVNDAASSAKKRELMVMEALENNRFGVVAEELQTKERRLEIEPPPIEKTRNESERNRKEDETVDANFIGDGLSLNVDGKEVGECEERGADEVARRRRERRSAFLAARLTFGVDGETLRRCETQAFFKKEVGICDNALDEAASSRRVNKEREQNVLATGQEQEMGAAGTNKEKNGATTFNIAKEGTAENELASDENISGYDVNEGAGKTRGQRKGGYASARVGENERRSGGEANVGETAIGGGSGGVFENFVRTQVEESKTFGGELPPEVRRRFEETSAPEIMPEYAEKIRLYRRRVVGERR